MQKLFNLSTFYIITTENGYNAFCLDKITLKQLLDVYKASYFVCQDFVKYCLNRGHFTLRINAEKQLILIVYSNSKTFIKSNAHKEFFKTIFDYHFNNNSCFDNDTKIIWDSWESIKHGVTLNGKESI